MARKKEKKPQRVHTESDLGTPELRNHYVVEERGDGARKIAYVINHPLDFHHSRGEINDEQHRAGCKLFNDWSVSHNHRNTLAVLGGEIGVPIYQIDFENPHTAMERYMRAMKFLNKISKTLALQVCIEGRSLTQVRGIFSWSKRNTGLDRLKETLDDLADFYEQEWRDYQRWLEKNSSDNHITT